MKKITASKVRRVDVAVADTAPTERGRRTRRALMDAALDLMEAGRSFNSLSLREVAQAAGVAPATFYRHFRDMDEICLILVDDCGRSLRPLLREARVAGASYKDIIRESMLVYKKFVEENPRYFLIASGERHGGSPIMRAAIRQEVSRFIDEMAQDLTDLQLLPKLKKTAIRNVCDLVVNTMLSAASDIRDLSKIRSKTGTEMFENYIWQMRMIFLGASTWRDKA
jgi:AcrR family transcriptional regulator